VDPLGLDARCLDTAGRMGRVGDAVGQDEDDVMGEGGSGVRKLVGQLRE